MTTYHRAMPSMPTSPFSLARILAVCAMALAGATCGHDHGDVSSDQCRLHPEDCHGGAGELCHDDGDCGAGLFCCTDDNNCGGGMCTAACHDDHDCPADMLCEHDMCFYHCNSDADCAATMSCEHNNTICEYP